MCPAGKKCLENISLCLGEGQIYGEFHRLKAIKEISIGNGDFQFLTLVAAG